VAAANLVLVPTVVLGELYAGFELGSRAAENATALQELLAEPFVRVIAPSADVARRYGLLVAALRRAGTPIPTNDVWIAACALDNAAPLLTSDAHFGLVAGLAVSMLAEPPP
jgi:tRNA(fMet)-specific endonuclease VapC